MSILKFSDGMQFDTSGPLRVDERSDGFYVVGQGFLLPVKSRQAAETEIEHLRKFV